MSVVYMGTKESNTAECFCCMRSRLEWALEPRDTMFGPFLGCLVVDPETHICRQDPEESLRGRASIGVSCEDRGASREVAAVHCFVAGEVQAGSRVRAKWMPHIQDEFKESVCETIFGVREIQILDVGGVHGDQGVQHCGVLLLHALPVGVGIGTQGHHVWGRDQTKVVLARPLKRVCVTVEFPIQDRADGLGVHAIS